jgi:hypothetical protein
MRASTHRKISPQIFPPYFPGVNILQTLTYRCAVRCTELVEQGTVAFVIRRYWVAQRFGLVYTVSHSVIHFEVAMCNMKFLRSAPSMPMAVSTLLSWSYQLLLIGLPKNAKMSRSRKPTTRRSVEASRSTQFVDQSLLSSH